MAVALLVAGAYFMENLDATVITTALPTMAADFGEAAAHLSVGVSAYLVALTVFIPISGWAADRFGARRVFAWAIVLFTLASAACAAAQGLWSFTLARTLQGIGGAMMVPVGRLLVLRGLPKSQLVRAIAILTWPGLVAFILGPPVGGWISTHWGWRWIFLLNLPLGLMAWVALLRWGPPSRPAVARFDAVGFVLSGLGFALFMGGIELASRPDCPAAAWALTLAAGAGLLAWSVRHLRRAAHPLFGLAPLAITTFRVTALGGSLSRTAIGAAPFLLPLMFQIGFGWSAVDAGAMLLWLFAGNLAMKPATTALMRRFGFRRMLVGNGLLLALGFAACATLQAETPRGWMAVLLFVSGMNRSMQFTALNTLGFADVPEAQMRDATTLFSVLQQMNASMGIAVGALALSVAGLWHGTSAGQPSVADFQGAFWLLAALALLALVDSWHLPAQAGQQVLRR
ncbi:MFS transporter [Ideonella oryzae]|uniref:MFS transporter n=1 Tax=Ideonella oryzae TaxID=2937441 RepID=A0ABT1BGP1_9BURK|nr:MFS transporter [Ideonella oryzae]MCO5975390.1 MFS transporter [Ideonella oryzae]